MTKLKVRTGLWGEYAGHCGSLWYIHPLPSGQATSIVPSGSSCLPSVPSASQSKSLQLAALFCGGWSIRVSPQPTYVTPALSYDFRRDLEWWIVFATPWDGRSFFLSLRCTPLQSWSSTLTAVTALGMVLTAESNGLKAGGTPTGPYTASSRSSCPVTPCLGSKWHTLHVQLNCDNQLVSHCISSGTSYCPHIMYLLCNLILLADMHITARCILGLKIWLLIPSLIFVCRNSGSWLCWPPTPTLTSLPLQQIWRPTSRQPLPPLLELRTSPPHTPLFLAQLDTCQWHFTLTDIDALCYLFVIHTQTTIVLL